MIHKVINILAGKNGFFIKIPSKISPPVNILPTKHPARQFLQHEKQ